MSLSAHRFKFIAAALLVAAVVAAALFWRFGRALDVPIGEARQGEIAVRVLGPGTVQARVAVTVSARMNATVTQMLADVGDEVRQGQALAVLDDRDLSARRGSVGGQMEALARNTEGARAAQLKAEADLELARSKQRRDTELLAQGFVSQAVLDASNAALRAAEAGVESARATVAARNADAKSLSQEARFADVSLSHARLASPIDGIVIQRLAEPGNTVTVGSPLFKLVDPRTLWVATRVDESVVGKVEVGQPASIRLRSGETVPGSVARIARQSDAATRELDVHVAFKSVPRRFAIDQEAEVSIDAGRTRGIVVPVGALTRDRTGREGVLVVADGRTRFQHVRTDGADDRQVRVVEGLAGGEPVVAVAAGVMANQRVRAMPAAERP